MAMACASVAGWAGCINTSIAGALLDWHKKWPTLTNLKEIHYKYYIMLYLGFGTMAYLDK